MVKEYWSGKLFALNNDAWVEIKLTGLVEKCRLPISIKFSEHSRLTSDCA